MMQNDLYARWGIQQGMHVTASETPFEFFTKLKAYNGYDISGKVAQDVLVMAGAEDHFVPLQQFFRQLKLLTMARSVTGQIFTAKDQAQSHCQIGNLALSALQMMAWIEAHSL